MTPSIAEDDIPAADAPVVQAAVPIDAAPPAAAGTPGEARPRRDRGPQKKRDKRDVHGWLVLDKRRKPIISTARPATTSSKLRSRLRSTVWSARRRFRAPMFSTARAVMTS